MRDIIQGVGEYRKKEGVGGGGWGGELRELVCVRVGVVVDRRSKISAGGPALPFPSLNVYTFITYQQSRASLCAAGDCDGSPATGGRHL